MIYLEIYSENPNSKSEGFLSSFIYRSIEEVEWSSVEINFF